MTAARLAWNHLAHHSVRTLIALAGVGFAVLLVFMQLGFYNAVERTATMLFDHLKFDLILVSTEHQDLTRLYEIPRHRVDQVRAHPLVEGVNPITVSAGMWRNPEQTTGQKPAEWSQEGKSSSIFILAVPPEAVPLIFQTGRRNGVFPDEATAADYGARLAQLDTAIMDRTSRPEFGNFSLFQSQPRPLVGARLNGRPIEIIGEFSMGTGFNWKGMIICSEATLNRYFMRSGGEVTFGLIRLQPGADPLSAREQLTTLLPDDVRVLTPSEIARVEKDYWVGGNALGQLLAAGAILALVVGVIFLYQLMSADIRSRMPEFATIKALGYPPPYLTAVVLWQALYLAVLGYIPGFLVSLVLYEFAEVQAGLPMEMTLGTATLVLVSSVVMCMGSGALAVRKVHGADPANLF